MTSARDRQRRARLAAGLLLVAASLLAAGCSSPPPDPTATLPPTGTEEVRRGGTLVYATSGKLSGFNQLSPRSASLLLYSVMVQVWPSVFEDSPDGRPELNRHLVESAEMTGTEPQTVVYRINPKATWSDGVPFDGDDFVYLWRTAYTRGAKDVDGSDIAATTASFQGVLRDVSASEDGRTVTVVFSRPYPDWKSLFRMIPPAHVAQRVGWNRGFDTFDPDVVLSAGPYRIEGHNPDRDLTLVRNERFWGAPPNLDSIVFRLLPDTAQVLAATKNREVDLADFLAPPVDLVNQARSVPGVTTVVFEQNRYARLYFNFRSRLVATPEVRRAIALAIDRPGIYARQNAQIEPGKGRITNNRLYVPTEPGYRDTSGGRYDRPDVEGARQLLESAGFQRGGDGIYARGDERLVVRLPTGTGPGTGIVELIQAQLREAGVEVRPEAVPDPLAALRSGDFDLGLTGRPTGGDAKSFETGQFTTGGGFNFGKYSNPTVDELIAQANSELDDARRHALHHRIDEAMWEDMPTLPLQQGIGVIVHRDTFANIVPQAGGGIFAFAHRWGLRRGA